MKRCMYCGHENDDSLQICEKCGYQLIDMPQDEHSGLQEQDVPEESQEAESPEILSSAPEQAAGDDLQGVLAAGDVNLERENGFKGEELPEGSETDVNRGQTYAAAQQVDPEEQAQQAQQYGGQSYTYDAQAEGQQQYGGQAYGYEGETVGYGAGTFENERPRGNVPGSVALLKKARRRIHNPIGFLAMLFFTVHVIAAILNVALGNAITNLSTVSHTITNYVGTNVAVNYMNSVVQLINSINHWYLLGAGLVALIPSVLLMFGLWMAFTGTTNKRVEISTAGYTLSRVAVILKFIGVCAVIIGCIVFGVVFVISAGMGMNSTTAKQSSPMILIAGVIVLLLMILIAVFVIMYYVQVIFSIRLIRTNVKSGLSIGRIPGYAVFVGFLGCALTVLTMIPMAPDDYIGLVAKGAYAAWLLFISLWTVIYKATVKIKRNK